MNIIMLTVDSNYHSPIIIREIINNYPKIKFKVIISGKNGRVLNYENLRKAIKNYGLEYITFKIVERIKYKFFQVMEKIRKTHILSRNYLNLHKILNHFNIEHSYAKNINDDKSLSELKQFSPDMILSIYFDQILKEKIFKIPSIGSVNLHPSLLPLYRGVSPIFWVLANNENTTGVTIHEISKHIDAGRILYQKKIKILKKDTVFSLYRRSSMASIELFKELINHAINEKILPTSYIQRKENKPSYFSKVTKDDFRRFRGYRRKLF